MALSQLEGLEFIVGPILQLPQIKGFEFTLEIRQLPKFQGLEFVIDDSVDPIFNQAPTVKTAISDQETNAFRQFTFVVPENTFEDLDGDVLTYKATLDNGDPLPDWLSFDAGTRTFSGFAPKDSDGTLLLKVTVDDHR